MDKANRPCVRSANRVADAQHNPDRQFPVAGDGRVGQPRTGPRRIAERQRLRALPQNLNNVRRAARCADGRVPSLPGNPDGARAPVQRGRGYAASPSTCRPMQRSCWAARKRDDPDFDAAPVDCRRQLIELHRPLSPAKHLRGRKVRERLVEGRQRDDVLLQRIDQGIREPEAPVVGNRGAWQLAYGLSVDGSSAASRSITSCPA